MSDEEPRYRDDESVRAVIERSESVPERLTIYAASESDDSDSSQWISAPKGSYVYLGLCR